jgi:TonB family protein
MLAAGQGRQNSDPEEKVYELGPGITQPRVTRQVTPHYSEARGVRVEGSVLIELIVSSRGLPQSPRVVKGIDKDVDQSAVDAVAQWRFDPAKKDDKPVAVKLTLEIEFHSM